MKTAILRIVALVTALALLCAQPALAFTFVNNAGTAGATNSCRTFSSVTNLTCKFDGAVTSGNFVWCIILAGVNNGVTMTSVVDTNSAAFHVSALAEAGSGDRGVWLAWLGNVGGGSAGTYGVTPTISSANANWNMACEQWSGVNSASDPSDVAPAAGNVQASPGIGTDGITSTGVTTVTNGDLLLGGTVNTVGTSGTLSAGSGFTINTSATGCCGAINLESKTQSTAGSGTVATFTQGTNNSAITYMLAVKAPGGGATVRPCTIATTGAGTC